MLSRSNIDEAPLSSARRVDAHQLRYFLAVVDHGTFTRAAESLYMAQPSLSQAIRALERRLGVALFDRTVQPIRLTGEGRRFVPAARELLADLDAARAAVHAVRELKAGRLDIVTHAGFSVEPLVPLIQRFRSTYGETVVNVTAAESSAHAYELVRRGDAEIAVADTREQVKGLRSVSLARQEVVVTGVAHLLAQHPDPLPRRLLLDLPLILGIGTTVDLGSDDDSSTPHQNPTLTGPNIVASCANPRAVWSLVSRGAGVALLPRAIASAYLDDTVSVALDPPVYRTPSLVTRAEPLSPAAAVFVSLAQARPTVSAHPTNPPHPQVRCGRNA